MHQTRFSVKIPHGGFSQIRSQIRKMREVTPFLKFTHTMRYNNGSTLSYPRYHSDMPYMEVYMHITVITSFLYKDLNFTKTMY